MAEAHDIAAAAGAAGTAQPRATPCLETVHKNCGISSVLIHPKFANPLLDYLYHVIFISI
jgi:hypothetical protein